jgi:hypothetical protein
MITESQFGIRAHTQIQNIDGVTFEFQPEHLICDECWSCADTAYAHASYYGTTTAHSGGHAITVTKKGNNQ